MKRTVLKGAAVAASFFLAACDYTVTPDAYTVPQESGYRSFAAAKIPRNLRGFDLQFDKLVLRQGDGRVDIPQMPACDAARIVLGDVLGVPFSCSFDGSVALLHSSPDPVSLMSLFIATLERAGASVIVRDQSLVISQGDFVATAYGMEGDMLPGVEAAEPVEGIDGYTVPDAAVFDGASEILTYRRRGMAAPVPSSFSMPDLLDAIDALSLDLRVISVGSSRFVVGDQTQVAAFSAFTVEAYDTVVPVSVAYLSDAGIDAVRSSFPALRLDVDSDASTVFVGGDPLDVAKAVQQLASLQPSVSRVRIDGLFFSYRSDDLKSLESSLSVLSRPFNVGNDGASVISAPFELVLDQVESSGFAQVVSKPSVSASFGRPSVFRSGSEIPIRGSVNPDTGAEDFEYRPTGITTSFTATPIGPHLIRLVVSVELSSVGAAGVVDNPTFDTQSIETVVDLARGDTVFLSGLTSSVQSASKGRALFLPNATAADTKSSLGLFVTLR